MDKYITKVARSKNSKLKKDVYLSGAISAYMSKDNNANVKYLLFGDSHYSMDNMCKGNCNDIHSNENENKINETNTNCWEITYIFHDIINKAKQEDKVVDVYIEIPYLGKGIVPDKEYIFEQVSKGGYLMKLFGVFYDCITKSPKCMYDNVRFHFIDIRQEFIEEDGKYDDSLLVYETFITTDLYENIILNFNALYSAINNKNDVNSDKKINLIKKYIVLIDNLLERLYDINDPLSSKLFKLYLESDNFEIDMYKELMNDLKLVESYDKKLMKEIVRSMIPQHVIVKRRNKVMHKIRAQLESLENENKVVIAKKIKKYIQKEYLKECNFDNMRKAWGEIMLIFLTISIQKDKITKEKFVSYLKKIEHRLMTIIEKGVTGSSLLMDTYTLSRMMRTFPQSKVHKESSYKIIFAGQEHIKRYVEFLEKNMNEKFDKYEPNYVNVNDEINRCFKVSYIS